MSHHENRYYKFINYYLDNQDIITDNYEVHHIIPRSEGGQNDQSNLVKLPIRAHYLAHFMLQNIYPNQISSFILMSKRAKRFNQRLYEMGKKQFKQYYNSEYFRNTKLPGIVEKQKNQKNKILPNGLTVAKNGQLKAAKTMSIPDQSGLTIRQRATIKGTETKRKKYSEIDPITGKQYGELISEKAIKTKIAKGNIVKGNDVNTALKINLYDNNDNLVVECDGDFFHFLETLDIPHWGPLRNTYINNQKYIYDHSVEESLRERLEYIGYCYRKNGNLFVLLDANKEVICSGKQMSYISKLMNFSNQLHQHFTKTFRDNSVIPDVREKLNNHLKYKKIDGYYARLVEENY